MYGLPILALVVGPQLWVKRVMERYNRPEDRYELSGGDAARKLLDAAGLHTVKVETTDHGDHYDPGTAGGVLTLKYVAGIWYEVGRVSYSPLTNIIAG